ADLLYGGERFLTTINMSEFQEKHSVSRLLGAPPGYVGYGEGGMLTEAVRQKPYSVILLDEIEKADPEVLNVFYQVFDKGVANDGEGREINFRNTLILMTSNLASEQIMQLCAGGQRPDAAQLEQSIRPTLSRHFKPALLARMRVVPYYPVDDQVLRELIALKRERFGERLQRRQLGFSHSPALVEHFAGRCQQGDSGARLIDYLIDQQLQPRIVDQVLDSMATGASLSHVHATLDAEGALVCEFAGIAAAVRPAEPAAGLRRAAAGPLRRAGPQPRQSGTAAGSGRGGGCAVRQRPESALSAGRDPYPAAAARATAGWAVLLPGRRHPVQRLP